MKNPMLIPWYRIVLVLFTIGAGIYHKLRTATLPRSKNWENNLKECKNQNLESWIQASNWTRSYLNRQTQIINNKRGSFCCGLSPPLRLWAVVTAKPKTGSAALAGSLTALWLLIITVLSEIGLTLSSLQILLAHGQCWIYLIWCHPMFIRSPAKGRIDAFHYWYFYQNHPA
jgi:hypothetical protein